MRLNANDSPCVALVGAGAWGSNHVRVWHELGALRVVCDNDEERLRDVRKRFPEIEAVSDFHSVLERDDVDGIVIATPAATHASLAILAMQSGKDVLIEKPLALSPGEAERVIRVSREFDRVVLVGHVLEYHPAVHELKKLIDGGALGRIRYIYSNRLNFGKIRTEENALWSFAPHDIAIMLRLLEMDPEGVTSTGGSYLDRQVADVTMTTLQFPHEVRGHIFVSWLHPFKEHRFVVVGERQMAVFDDTQPWETKLSVYPHQVDWMDGRVPVARKAEAHTIPLDKVEPLLAECNEFMKCMKTRQQPLTDALSAFKVLEVLESAQRSLDSDESTSIESDSTRPFIHPTAVVDAGAQVGRGTRVWHFSHVMARAQVGRNCSIGQNVFIASGVLVGDDVRIQNNVSLFEGVQLEDHVFCGPSMVFTNVINPRSEIERKNEYQTTLVRKGATLGANATVLCGITIGSYAFVGAGAVVTRDVPDFNLVVGNPARIVGWMCRCGVRLRFGSEMTSCLGCGANYRRLDEQRIALCEE